MGGLGHRVGGMASLDDVANDVANGVAGDVADGVAWRRVWICDMASPSCRWVLLTTCIEGRARGGGLGLRVTQGQG